jgi:hypothetical protein
MVLLVMAVFEECSSANWIRRSPKSAMMRPRLERELRKHPEISYRSCLRLLLPTSRYSPRRLENACLANSAGVKLRQKWKKPAGINC